MAPKHPLRLALGLVVAASLAAPLCPAAPAKGLPRLASTALPAPEPPQVTELDSIINQLVSGKPDDVKAGQARLKEAGATLLPAMGRRLTELRKAANREQIGIYIGDARKGRKKAEKDSDKEGGKKKKGEKKAPPPDDPSSDWLQMVYARVKAGDQAYRDLVTVLAIERALVDIGTTPAARELINVYVYFGDLFRIDVQHMIARMGDRAVPALLEARKHDVEKVRGWASRQLDVIGKAVPGETVQIPDPEIVADVLRAYGRTRDIDALRVIVSFTSSDRAGVRDAAREALVSFGEAALWQLREAYESLMGKRPPPGHTWDSLARELFEHYDRARLEEIFGTFEEGQKKEKEGALSEMAAAYDSVLSKVPSFERRSEMSDGYLKLARDLSKSDVPQALLYARKSLRLDPQGPQAKATESFIATLEGEELMARGVVDTASFKRALEIDPNNGRARDHLAALEVARPQGTQGSFRYLAAAAIGAIATIAALVIGLWRRGAVPPAEAPPAETGPSYPDNHRVAPGEAASADDASITRPEGGAEPVAVEGPRHDSGVSHQDSAAQSQPDSGALDAPQATPTPASGSLLTGGSEPPEERS